MEFDSMETVLLDFSLFQNEKEKEENRIISQTTVLFLSFLLCSSLNFWLKFQ